MSWPKRRYRPVVTPLGAGPSAEQLTVRAEGAPGLLCLRGAWAGASPIVASHPLHVLTDGDDPVAALDAVAASDGPRDVVGGGWFGLLPFAGRAPLAFYDHLVRLVHGQWQFEALHSDERTDALVERLDAWRALLAGADVARPWRVGVVDGPRESGHLAAVEGAIELIRAGELYQVNVCTRLRADFDGSAAAMFGATSAALDPARGAFFATEGGAVVSLSPELFLQRRGRDVRSAPIKGTLPRSEAGNDERLRRSAKDSAENVMIVDLVRNDLGRVCEPGSVRASALLDVEPHAGVWHLVSTVEGRLRDAVGDRELMSATFPPGSVTGAPKVRALAAIAALESTPRQAYTGALGFVSPCWGAEFSVVIRTFELEGNRLDLGVGGGVTADSVPVSEWRECLQKAAPLVAAARTTLAAHLVAAPPPPRVDQLAGGLLETILAVDGRPLRLADHLARLDRSSRELYASAVAADVAERVRTSVAGRRGRWAVRVVADGAVTTVAARPLGPPPDPGAACVVGRSAGTWRHKWADRRELTALEATAAPSAALFVAADGTVLETSRGNVFLIAEDGGLVTPPLRDDLLPGVTRRAVLDLARDAGRRTSLREFGVDELIRRPAFWTSSLSGAVALHHVGGVALPRADDLVTRLAAAVVGSADDR